MTDLPPKLAAQKERGYSSLMIEASKILPTTESIGS
jgi:hypothetical protein